MYDHLSKLKKEEYINTLIEKKLIKNDADYYKALIIYYNINHTLFLNKLINIIILFIIIVSIDIYVLNSIEHIKLFNMIFNILIFCCSFSLTKYISSLLDLSLRLNKEEKNK